MKVLKGVALGLAGFFLFIGLLLLGITFNVNSTVLNSHFVVTEIEKLDLATVAQQILNDNDLSSSDQSYVFAINKTLNQNKLWINQQIESSVGSFYYYLLGKTETLDITITTEPIKQSFSHNLTQIYTQSPPPDYQRLSSSEQNAYLDQIQQDIANNIPSTITINQDNIPSDIWQTIQTAKEITDYIRTAYFALIALCVVLILLIILITREIKAASLSLGITFLVAGVLSITSLIMMQLFVPSSIPTNDVPVQIRNWLIQLISDYLSPWKIYSIILLVLGVLLVATSFFFHGKQPRSTVTTPV
jgi:hypothetical protein